MNTIWWISCKSNRQTHLVLLAKVRKKSELCNRFQKKCILEKIIANKFAYLQIFSYLCREFGILRTMNQNYPSVLLEQAVNQFAQLPGVGRKSSLRHVLWLLKQPEADVDAFADALKRLRHEVQYCKQCHNISDHEVCPICMSPNHDKHTICVVENVQDVMQIENTGQYTGLYHVLGGIISPMDGIGPKDIEIDSLVERMAPEAIQEVILALPSTMEGDTTNFYIYRRLQPSGVRVSQIARGIAIGGEIEYTDELTLGRSILNRTEFKC